MDRISNLSDDLLLKILSLLPTKDVIATTLLSKRWKFLWTMVHKLAFNDDFVKKDYVDGLPSSYERFRQFVDRVMVLHRAPVLQTLKFDVGPFCNSEDMATWVRIGMVRDVPELEISHSVEFYDYHQSIILPRSLYMYAKLEVLKLTNTIVLDVPTAVCLPSLRSLHLLCVEYRTDECHRKLLSGCPVLKELVVDKSENSFLPCLYVVMPSLVRLSILETLDNRLSNGVTKVVINAPSLKYLNIIDECHDNLLSLSKNMTEMDEANVNVVYESTEMLMGSLTSVKRLSYISQASLFMFIRLNASASYRILSACSPGIMWMWPKMVESTYLDARKFSQTTSSQAQRV